MENFSIRKVLTACEKLKKITGHQFLIASQDKGSLINVFSNRDPRLGTIFSEPRSLFANYVLTTDALKHLTEFIDLEKLRIEAIREITNNER